MKDELYGATVLGQKVQMAQLSLLHVGFSMQY